MLVKESFSYIDSHRDLHFTDSLITGASEYENIAFPTGPAAGPDQTQNYAASGALKCHITGIRLIAATQHDFKISFYSRRGGYRNLAATPYAGSLIGVVSLVGQGSQRLHPTASEYIYATDFSAIQYMDEDGLNELHVGLHNLDSKTKAALGSTNLSAGVFQQYIQIRFTVISAA